MKKKLILLTALLSVISLTGCSTDAKTSFNANWRKDTIKPNTDVMLSETETLTYSVEFEPNAAAAYSLDYKNGSFKTTLSAKNGNYFFETELNVEVAFTVGGEKSDYYADVVKTEVELKSTQNGLFPVSSKKTVHSHSPADAYPVDLKTAMREYSFTVTTTYDGANGTSVFSYLNEAGEPTENGTRTKNFEIPTDYSYLDNESLLLAIRAVDSNATERFLVYNASTQGVQTVKLERKETATDTLTFKLNGADKTEAIPCVKYALSIDASNAGATQQLVIAQKTDASNNTWRNVLLRYETPLSYNLGTLVYKLTDANLLDF